jgi:hypothetical protein
LVREVECGFCVREGNVTGLVAAIMKLRNNPELHERMKHNARPIFEGRFDKPFAIETWRHLLAHVAGENMSV